MAIASIGMSSSIPSFLVICTVRFPFLSVSLTAGHLLYAQARYQVLSIGPLSLSP